MMIRRQSAQMIANSAAVLLIAAIVSACTEQPTATPPPAPQVTVESGFISLTPAAPDDESGVVTAGEPSAPLVAPDILTVGAEVQARGMLRVYGDANPNAPTLAEYAAGNRLTVLDPPGNFVAYPVELSGVRWYRVRAEDGLVGWVMADGIEVVKEPDYAD